MEIEIYCQNLRDFRKNCKLSQEKLADILGVSRQTIFSLETGK
ncbi:transcriptional regulator, partial [Candidatus Berkelbacteria bacterium CG_4_9_14_3_um_filter_33_5]